MTDTSIQYSYTADELVVIAQRFNCCLGHIGQSMSLAEKKGKREDIIKYQEQIFCLENIIDAVVCFDVESETNILTNLELVRLVESGGGICGGVCNDSTLQTDLI